MSSLLEVLRSFRKSGKTVTVCPNCGARLQRSKTPLEGWMLPARYLCASCGYSGFIVVEQDDEPVQQETNPGTPLEDSSG